MIIKNGTTFLHALRGYFFAAGTGVHHPQVIRQELGLDPQQWSYLAKTHIYPEASLGRLALSSVNTEVMDIKPDPVGPVQGRPVSVFRKTGPVLTGADG